MPRYYQLPFSVCMTVPIVKFGLKMFKNEYGSALHENGKRKHVKIPISSEKVQDQEKSAIRKRFPLQKPRWEKTKLTIMGW